MKKLLLPFVLWSITFNYYVISTTEFLTKYSNIDYDTNSLHAKHHRVQRSLDKHIEFSFKSYDREFNLYLTPTLNNHFKSDLSIELHSENKTNVKLPENIIYDGYLIDEPTTSKVKGSVVNGKFTGNIETKSGKYFIEPSLRYSNQTGVHSVIYHESDIKNIERIGCGTHSEETKDALKNEQKRFAPRKNISKRGTFEDSLFKYSKEANKAHARNKRATRTEFPQGKSVCSLYLKVDPYFYSTIFNAEGNQDIKTTLNYITTYLSSYVDYLNTVFSPLQFFAGSSTYYSGVTFQIYRLKIYTDAVCSGTTLSATEKKICEPYLDAVTFLNYASLDDNSDYCLGYTFTSRDFSTGTLGLAWVASNTGSVGGVCENSASIQELVTLLTVAHEVGHSFGSEHDPEGTCSPGGTNGNYIMYSRATSGSDPNNQVFSSCSLQQMGSIFSFIVSNKFCFESPRDAICGNGIIETGEQCDCGFPDQCTESCCDSTTCQLRSGSVCSPSMGVCCESDCSYSLSSKTCFVSTDCKSDTSCSGVSAECPSNSGTNNKPNLTECNGQTQICINGECTGSICEKFQMTQCYLQGSLSDPNVNKRNLCHLACTGSETNNVCKDSFEIASIVNVYNQGIVLKPGSPCAGTNGYCDVFSNCRSADTNQVLARLASTILSPTLIEDIKIWAETYWWAILIFVIVFLVLFNLLIWGLSKLMPSSNPNLQVKINKTYPKNQSLMKGDIGSSQVALTSRRREKPPIFTTDIADHLDGDADYEKERRKHKNLIANEHIGKETRNNWKPFKNSEKNLLNYNDTVYNEGILNEAYNWRVPSENENQIKKTRSKSNKKSSDTANSSILKKTAEYTEKIESNIASANKKYNERKNIAKNLETDLNDNQVPKRSAKLPVLKNIDTEEIKKVAGSEVEASSKWPSLTNKSLENALSKEEISSTRTNVKVVKEDNKWTIKRSSEQNESDEIDDELGGSSRPKPFVSDHLNENQDDKDSFEMD